MNLRRVGRYCGPSLHCEIFGTILQTATAAVGLYQGKKASDAAKDAGKKQAKIERRVTEEELRQLGRRRLSELGALRAGAAYSGADVNRSGTVQALERDMAREFDLSREFTEEVGASQAKTVQRQAQNMGDALFMNALTNSLAALGDIDYSAFKPKPPGSN